MKKYKTLIINCLVLLVFSIVELLMPSIVHLALCCVMNAFMLLCTAACILLNNFQPGKGDNIPTWKHCRNFILYTVSIWLPYLIYHLGGF